MSKTRFDRYRQPKPCINCGKNTTGSSGDCGTGLCPKCFDNAGLENEHLDGHHNEIPNANCLSCNPGTKPA